MALEEISPAMTSAPVTTVAQSASKYISDEEQEEKVQIRRGLSFWAIITALCVMSILTALENTAVTTSLPVIVQELNMGENYIWVTNVFFLTSAAVQPLFGQFANIFGRRWLTMFIVLIFTVGSAICGGASSGGGLIAGRAVQGIGSGGLNMIVDVIISDLVPLRERGNFIAIVLTVYFVGTAIGPFIGGLIVETTTWRWVFLVNLPVGGAALLLLYLFLHVSHNRKMTIIQKIKRIDYIGNTIIMASSVAILFALTYSGSRYSWSSWNTLVPLVIGLCGFVLFTGFERSKFCVEPVMPPHLLGNRTSAIVYIVTFFNSLILYWVMYFLPVYFQGVLRSSPARTGIQLFPVIFVGVPGAVISVVVLSKFGKYRLLHQVGFSLGTIALGLFTLLDRHSSAAEWIGYQILAGLGAGMVLNTLLPAFQAAQAESDQAYATATWAFIRSFGNIWGVAIPAAIFNARTGHLSFRLSDLRVRKLLSDGHAYEYATSAFIDSHPENVQAEIISVYSDSLKLVWQIAIVFSGLASCLVFLEKEIKLRTELETEFGLEERKKKTRKNAMLKGEERLQQKAEAEPPEMKRSVDGDEQANLN